MAQITLTWPASSSADVIAYEVGYTKGAQDFQLNAPTGLLLTADLRSLILEIDLDSRMLYRFWVKAVDVAGNKGNKRYIANALQTT